MYEEYTCEMKEPEKMYRIGMFSKMNQVTIKTLRYYDDIGLLKASYVDESNGYRYYTSEQLPKLHEILALREMGFTIDEINEIQNGTSKKQLLARKRSEIMTKIAEETMRLSKVESYLARDDKMNLNSLSYPVVVKELPEVIVASMRRIMPSYESLFSMMPEMGAEMERLGCVCAEPEYCFNIYHDGEYKERDIDVEICESVVEARKDSELVQFKTIKKVPKAACVLHKGPYNEFPKAYQAVLEYIEENGYEIAGYPRESYIDGVWNKDSEQEWLTEIQVPLKD